MAAATARSPEPVSWPVVAVVGVVLGRSRFVGDQPIERVQREPGDEYDGRDEQDLEEQNHDDKSDRGEPVRRS